MEYIVIEVPDMNDSVSRIVLNGTQYQIRFTWHDITVVNLSEDVEMPKKRK